MALIFGTFRNPDKETVLTPWRVVNMHLGKTIGGYSFYDKNYQNTTVDGVDAAHWIHTDYTGQVFNRNAHVLEINSKTGLYPLYVATSRYFQEYEKQKQATAGNVSLENKRLLWQQILRENIFCVAKTPMAREIAKRTLTGYQDYDTNIVFVDKIVEDSKQDVDAEAKKIKEVFGNLKFDVVIGNPPYQDETTGDNDTFRAPIYNDFQNLSECLADLVTLITPGRYLFGAGRTPKEWNRKMMNDRHLKIIHYFADSSKVFPRTDIKGGVVITLWDKSKSNKSIDEIYSPAGIYIPFNELNSIMHKVVNSKFVSFSNIVYPRTIYSFTEQLHKDYPNASSKLSKGHAYDVSSNIFDRLPEIFFDVKPDNDYKYVKIIGRKQAKRIGKYIRSDYINETENLNKYKVFVPSANGSGALGETISTPMIGTTETFMSIGKFKTLNEAKAAEKYIKTKFARALLGILKITQHNPVSTWKLIPLQDFTSNSDIDWSKSIPEIDQQLYRKYNLSQDEIDFIETKVQAMD